jgi:hypothetical protein
MAAIRKSLVDLRAFKLVNDLILAALIRATLSTDWTADLTSISLSKSVSTAELRLYRLALRADPRLATLVTATKDLACAALILAEFLLSLAEIFATWRLRMDSDDADERIRSVALSALALDVIPADSALCLLSIVAEDAEKRLSATDMPAK